MRKFIKHSLYFLLPFLVVGCAVATEPAPELPTALPKPTSSSTLTPQPTPEPTPTEEPPPERYNFLLLGGDYTAHRQGTKWGNKTDVMLLVSLLMSEPPRVTVIQIPRNLYVPVNGLPDMYAFAVFSLEGWQGVHYWWQEVFGIDLNAGFYIHMDNFVKIVDGIGGVDILLTDYPVHKRLSGVEVLAYLRDNENNWGCKWYDCEGRQFRVLNALYEAARGRFKNDPVSAAGIALKNWGGMIESDISSIEQFVWIFRLGWMLNNTNLVLNTFRLAAPDIARGEVPLEPGRAEVPVVDLHRFMACRLAVPFEAERMGCP